MTARQGGVTLVMAAVGGITLLGKNANSTFKSIGNTVRDPNQPSPQETRLKKLGAAFEAFQVEHGHYPPAATFAKDGAPLLSWRIALLPYLGEKKLYAEFRQDEPWDSFHNKKLISKLPDVFNKPWFSRKGVGTTQVVTGPGTLFDGPNGVKKPSVARRSWLWRSIAILRCGGRSPLTVLRPRVSRQRYSLPPNTVHVGFCSRTAQSRC